MLNTLIEICFYLGCLFYTGVEVHTKDFKAVRYLNVFMKYSQLVGVYDELEKTSKRLEKIEIIADFLKKVDKKELKEVVYLVEGRIFPEWDKRKIGFSNRLMIKALSVGSGESFGKIEELFRKKGDLGLVAEEVFLKKKQSTLSTRKLESGKVMENIRKLAELEGKGTVERKIRLITELLGNADWKEAKYLVKTVLENLRIGVSSGIIRDSIARGFELNADDVERAADLSGDYGEVAELASAKRLGSVGLRVGKPVKCMLAILADDVEECFKALGEKIQLENKIDGFRCITGLTPIYEKNKGFISVRDIKKGDCILTHKGNFKKILDINKRTIDKGERLFKVQTFLGNEFKITEGHKVLIKRKNKILWKKIEDVSKQDLALFPIPKLNYESVLGENFVLADNSGYTKTIKADDNFFRFLGFWIGDGFTNNYHNTERVGLLFNAKTEKKLCSEYKKIIEKNFKIKKTTISRSKNVLNLYFRDKPFRIWLSKNFRREWKGKMIPDWFYGISNRQFNSFFDGWVESDGHVDAFNRICVVTKERDLAMRIQLLGLIHNRIFGLKRLRINGKNYYKLIIQKKEKHSKIEKNYIVTKFLKLQKIKRDPRVKLYNLEVEEDKSYCTGLISLHNCQIHKKNTGEILIFTRRMEDVTEQFPDIVGFLKKHVKGDNYILDGEAVGYDKKTGRYLPFQTVSQRIRRKYNIKEMAEKFPVEMDLFDVIYYGGKNLMGLPLVERRKVLENLVKEKKREVVLTKKLVTDNKKRAEDFFKKVLKDGFEGVMAKNLESEYKPGRYVNGWMKLKNILEPLDLVIVKAEYGEGKRAGWLTSYTLACKSGDKFLELGKVSTGVKEKETEKAEGVTYKEMTNLLKPLIEKQKGKGNEVEVKPKIIIEVGYEEIQKSQKYSSGFGLRFPRVRSLRDDKTLKDVSDINLVEKIFKIQKRKK